MLTLCAVLTSLQASPLTYPADAYSRPLHDSQRVFETLVGCAPEGDVAFRAAHYLRDDLRLADDAGRPVAQWILQPRDGTSATMGIDFDIHRAATAVSFEAENRSAQALTLGLFLQELPWPAGRDSRGLGWVLGPPQPLAPGERRRLVFPFSEASSPGHPEVTQPQFPLVRGVLTIVGLEQDQATELRLSRLAVEYPPAAGVAVSRLDVLRDLAPGRPLAVEVEAEGIGEHQVDIEFRAEPHVLWRVRLTDGERVALRSGSCRVERTAPWYLPPGSLTVGLVVDGYRAEGAVGHTVVAPQRAAELPRAERRRYHGRPTLFVDGHPQPHQGYSAAHFFPGNVSEFGAHGVNVLCVPTDAGRALYSSNPLPTWVAPDRFDYGQLEERVCFSLQGNPEALITLRVDLALPPFWLQEHEDQLVRVRTPQGDLIWEEGGTTRAASLASEAWAREQERALRELIRYCQSRPWAERLIGFWLTGEVTQEWFSWGSNDGFYADYSAANQAGFAHWLRGRALGGLAVPADPIPSPEARKCPDADLYPNTPDGRMAALYSQYNSDLTAGVLKRFARVVKGATDGRSLVGCFYGYVIQLAGEPRQNLSGHGSLAALLDDPNIDFIAGIPLHNFRRLDGLSVYTSATESILSHGKLYCNENDLFSWLHPVHWHTEYDAADPRGGAIAMHRRECANDAVHGALSQKFALFSSWHHDDALQDEFARQAAIGARALDYDRTPADEIAFVVDETTFVTTPPGSTAMGAAYPGMLYAVARTGAPVGVWLLSDLDRLPARTRLVVTASATAAKTAELAKLRDLLEAGGRTVALVGQAGFIDPEGWTRRLGGPAALLRLDPSGAEAEGPLPRRGRLIWRAEPVLDTHQWRQWAEDAGVHCYAPEGYFVHASRELVTITSPAAGTPLLTWPEPARVRDLFDGWTADGRRMRCPFALGQTRLFEVSSAP